MVALAFTTGCVALLEDAWYLASSHPTTSMHGDLAFLSTRVVMEDVACRRLVCTVRREDERGGAHGEVEVGMGTGSERDRGGG